MSKRAPQLFVLLVALFGAIAIAVVVLGDRNDPASSEAPGAQPGAQLEQLSGEDEARRSSERFLDTYVADNGRVMRTSDNDTVSEGQAYGMLLSLAIDDEEAFERIWTWTETNLLGDSGTLAWRWQNGAVIDENAATDADLDVARALIMAADRFELPEYRESGVALADALYDEDVVQAGDVSLLVAGPWAVDAPYVWNPSYVSPATFDLLADATGNDGWSDVRADGTELLYDITDDGALLPSDWASLSDDGVGAPVTPPGGGDIVFSYDAFRTVPRLLDACDDRSLELAQQLTPITMSAVDAGRERTDLDATGRDGGDANPLFMLAAAAGAESIGDDDAANSLADRAEAVEVAAPSYYVGAWVALTRVLVDTDWLDTCEAPG